MLPRHVALGIGNQPFWFNAYFAGGLERFTSIEGIGPLTPDGEFTIRRIANFDTFANGMAIDDYIIPEPPTALFALAAATLASLAASRRRRTRRLEK